jgi:hypothetical protein
LLSDIRSSISFKYHSIPKMPNQQPCDVGGKEDAEDVIFVRKSG